MKKRIYLDYAAATPVRPEVKKAMEPWFTLHFANPSALYQEADQTQKALSDSRQAIAKLTAVKSEEVIFVSGSTEANNLAIFGIARAQTKPGHIITTSIEHPSILEPLETLGKGGWSISRLPVDKEGFLNLDELREVITPKTVLVTLAWANPDIGVLQPVREAAKIIAGFKKKNRAEFPLLHIDASQVGNFFGLNIPRLGADLVTLSSSKIYGPRGIAALVTRLSGYGFGTLEPIIYGGGQERFLRSGTENVAGAVGFAKAFELAQKEKGGETERLIKLRDYLIEQVLKMEEVLLTGSQKIRLPNHASFLFKDMDGEELVVRLDEQGFAVGTGSACATNKDEISEAIKALNLPAGYQRGSLRVTLGKKTTLGNVKEFVVVLKKVVSKMKSWK